MNLLQEDPKELLKALVRFPSLSTNEQELVDWLEEAVSKTKLLHTDRYGDNIIFSIDSGKPGRWLLLNSHSDVVPPSANHHGDPFSPEERDGCIWGRGTTDAKGCGTAMLRSLLELAHEGWKPNAGKVSFALTICEETSGEFNGMAYLRTLMDEGRLPRPDAALIGEPTSLAPCVAQKGLLVVRLTTRGESGHAARVYGKNAIYEMADVLQKLRDLQFSEQNPFIGNIKITPTKISAGTVNNAMPESTDVILDIRTIPEIPNERILHTIQSAIGCEVEVISDRFVSTQTDDQSIIAQCALDASGQVFFGSPTASDWVFLSDIPVVKIGPGHSELSHKHNEHIEISQLNAGVSLYKSIIKMYFERINQA
ncbi:MAG: M20/M25/M40 family metallo-hydrolase [Bacteroidetes bacterium]|nr:M20/M25/M40 family metallo-hydrolase [Bacteroidota bacterium]MCH8523713.1 M20/M25/M40 family metallo-hydrolase [Balneolales bacterium]